MTALEAAAGDTRLAEYRPCCAARAELLVKVGASVIADCAYSMAAGLECDPAVRASL